MLLMPSLLAWDLVFGGVLVCVCHAHVWLGMVGTYCLWWRR